MTNREQIIDWATRHPMKRFDASGLLPGMRRSVFLAVTNSKHLQKTLWFDYKPQLECYDVSISFRCEASRELWMQLYAKVWPAEYQWLIAALPNPIPFGMPFSVGLGAQWGFDRLASTDREEPLETQLAKLEQLVLEPYLFGIEHEEQYLDALLSNDHPFQWWKTNLLIRATECFALAKIVNRPLRPVADRLLEFESNFVADFCKPLEGKAGVAELLEEAEKLSLAEGN
jgi:hypothetical protein